MPPSQVWDLQQQISHKADFLREHVLEQGSQPVVVLAHSIGAYMAAHALSHLTPADSGPPQRIIQVRPKPASPAVPLPRM